MPDPFAGSSSIFPFLNSIHLTHLDLRLPGPVGVGVVVLVLAVVVVLIVHVRVVVGGGLAWEKR